jgi:hypothetical protein
MRTTIEGVDGDVTVLDGDVEFAVDDGEAFTADVAMTAEDALLGRSLW